MSSPPPPPAKIALIGCGWWAQGWHLPHLSTNPNSKIVCVVDSSFFPSSPLSPSLLSLGEVGERYGCVVVGSVGEMVERGVEVDGVIVATNHSSHMEVGLELLNSPNPPHILMEKPMCTDVKQAKILHEACQKSNKLFLVNHSANWRPQTKTAHSLIKKQKKIGEIYHVCCLMASPLACIFENEACKGWNEAQEGMIGNGFGWGQASHILAWIFLVTGMKPKSVYGRLHHSKTTGADIYDTAIINCENNATITLNGIGVLPGNSHPIKEEEGEKEGKEGKEGKKGKEGKEGKEGEKEEKEGKEGEKEGKEGKEEGEEGEEEGKGGGEPKLIDVKIFGEKGCLFYGGNDGSCKSGKMEIRMNDGATTVIDGGFLFENTDKEGLGPESVQEFVNGCVGGDCFQGAGSEIGLYTVQAINAMYRSSLSGKVEDVE